MYGVVVRGGDVGILLVVVLALRLQSWLWLSLLILAMLFVLLSGAAGLLGYRRQVK